MRRVIPGKMSILAQIHHGLFVFKKLHDIWCHDGFTDNAQCLHRKIDVLWWFPHPSTTIPESILAQWTWRICWCHLFEAKWWPGWNGGSLWLGCNRVSPMGSLSLTGMRCWCHGGPNRGISTPQTGTLSTGEREAIKSIVLSRPSNQQTTLTKSKIRTLPLNLVDLATS